MSQDAKSNPTRAAIVDAIRRAARQEQFLEVVSAAEARRRFEMRLNRAALAGESLPLAATLSRVIAADVIAPIDTPPFDRANVDGFALRAADTLGAGPSAPKRLTLNREVIACGVAPALEVASGTATAIATGGVIPRGADAVVMIEHTELIEDDAVPGDRYSPRRHKWSVHLLRRIGYRARRNFAAPRHSDRLARDRHARGMRLDLRRSRAAAARRRAVDRLRAHSTRSAATSRRYLRQQWRHYRGRSR